MAVLKVTDRDGVQHEVQIKTTGTLMEKLRDLDYGVAALCGGVCSCATCHVYIDESWLARLPAAQSDEREVVSDLVNQRPNSRLSCQIPLKPEYDGLELTLAPEE